MKASRLFLIAFLLSSFQVQAVKHDSFSIAAYWFNGGWDHYDAEAAKYLDEVIIFAVAPEPKTGGINIVSVDEKTANVNYRRSSGIGLTTAMINTLVADAKKYQVKTTLGINAMGKKEIYFDQLVENNKQDEFAKNIRDLCLKHGISGVDLDYEHPTSDKDVQILASIFTALNKVLKPEGITVSGAFASKKKFSLKFLEQHHGLLDQINIMNYSKKPEQFIKELNTLVTKHKVPKEKLYGGIAFYAKEVARRKGRGKHEVEYRDIVSAIAVTNEEDVFKMPAADDASYMMTLKYSNNNKSLKEKIEFLKSNGFGGAIIWALNHDVAVTNPHSRVRYLRSLAGDRVL
ncbi:glycosyl hydrolase family 18 protein [Colwellia piezophila]|uniref:glycosyl hydrolase family 18 protein n=1 Tax=Colwellia piezophila TaxID=211668 RepID=UPI000361C060|nr:glycosyl hydrolase family 18 protein [Colwellia piezophila]